MTSRRIASCAAIFTLAFVSAGCASNGITVLDPQGKTQDVTPEDVHSMTHTDAPYLLQVGDEIDLAFRVATLKKGDAPWDYRIEPGDSMEVRMTPRSSDAESYRIDAGDVIGISFLNNWPLNAIRTVRTDGKITLAEVGDVVAGGMTPQQLQNVLTQRYIETGIIQGDPKVTVNVDFVNLDRLESMSRDVTVRGDGKIRLPQFQNDVLVAGLTISEASAALEAEAAKSLRNRPKATLVLFPGLNAALTSMDSRIEVGPDGRVSVPRLGDIQAAGYSLDEVRLGLKEAIEAQLHNPVDVLARLARATGSRIYVGGEVGVPGVYPLAATPTALQAVIMARGPVVTSRMNSVIVMRRNPDGKPYVFKTNLARAIGKGSTENDIPLQAFDVVFVPKKNISKVNLFVTQYIDDVVPFNNSLGVSGTYYMNEQQVDSKSRSRNLGLTFVPGQGLGALIP